MSWNYRVLKRDNLFAIYSVYYDDEGKIIACSENPEPAISEDFEYLKTQLNLMLEAIDKEVLEFEMIEEKIRSIY
jgi:hypothetical protein